MNSKKRILFINPPEICVGRTQIGWYFGGHPTSLLKLAGFQKRLGHQVSVIDCKEYVEGRAPQLTYYRHMPLGATGLGLARAVHLMGRSWDWFNEQLAAVEPPDEVWISTHLTFNEEPAHRVIELVRERFPRAEVIFGGNYPTLFPEEAGRSGARVHVGEIPEAATCFPDYDLFPTEPGYIVFQLTLGCPNRCAHCLNHRLTQKVVRFQPEAVADFIERNRRDRGVRLFINIDPNTAAAGLTEFLEIMAVRELDVWLYFFGGIQPDLVTRDLARLIKRVGLRGFTLPCELDEESNHRLGKTYSEEAFFRAVELFEAESVDLSRVHGTFPIGFKYDRPEVIRDRIDWITDHGLIAEMAPISLAPGTVEYDRHADLLQGKSLTELNWALWPTLDSRDKIEWYFRLTRDNLAEIELRR